jgi:hypothetical protein
VRPGNRVDLQRLSGQKLYSVIEFENSSIYREESRDMAAPIRAGKLGEKLGARPADLTACDCARRWAEDRPRRRLRWRCGGRLRRSYRTRG